MAVRELGTWAIVIAWVLFIGWLALRFAHGFTRALGNERARRRREEEERDR